jgi:hypothetical protein
MYLEVSDIMLKIKKSAESDRKMEENDKKTVQKTPFAGLSMSPVQNLSPPPSTKS